MIIVKVLLRPQGDASRDREIGEMTITLDHPTLLDSPDVGNYTVRILKSAHHGARAEGTWKRGRVCGYPRKSKRVGVWDLLRSALNNTLKSRPVWPAKEKADGEDKPN